MSLTPQGFQLMRAIPYALLLCCGCSDSRSDAVVEDRSKSSTLARSSSVATATTQPKIHFPTRTNTTSLGLQIVASDAMYRFMASELVAKRPAVSATLEKQKGTLDDGRIVDRDLESIMAELGKVKGFTVSDHGGTAIKFDRFMISIVGGYISEDYFNAYLIRIPGQGWSLLETRQVPAPLGTRSQ